MTVDLDFPSVVRAHQARYPLMRPQDYGKLAYQIEFGPRHMALEWESVLSGLQREWEEAPPGDASPVEDLGAGLCRFHLTGGCDVGRAAPLLARLFLRTARKRRGSLDGLGQKLELLGRLDIPGMDGWLAEYRRQGCPVPSHSEAFHAAYRPRYRLLEAWYAHSFSALLEIDRLARAGKPAVAAIDGRCGSGKTHFAALIQELFPCSVIHMDDYYLPMEKRPPGWEDKAGGHMDFSRFLSEILVPARNGAPLCCRPYDCRSGRLSRAADLPPRLLTVVEGSYSTHPCLAGQYDCTIFLTCSPQEQAKRLSARDARTFARFRDRWIPMEERYFKACGTQAGCGHAIDTSRFFTS